MKKTVRKNKEAPLAGRRFGVLLEEMDSNVKQVLEGHAVLDKKIDDFRYETRNDISSLKFGVRHIGETQKDFFVRMDRLEDELKAIKNEISDLKRLLVSKADLERLQVVEKKVHQLEVILRQKG